MLDTENTSGKKSVSETKSGVTKIVQLGWKRPIDRSPGGK